MAKLAVHIQGKDDTKAAIASAKSGIASMNSSLSSLKGTLNAVAGIMAFDKIMSGAKKAVSVIKDLTEAYAKQEQAEIRLSAAAINNINLSSKNVAALKEYAAELQKKSIFGDEDIIQQEAMLATMELSEQQIKEVMRAAVDLASTGMMSLESATKNLSKTFSGQKGELGELIPGLRNLTAEQLKAGEAVEYIKKQYSGMAEAVASGVSGQQQQIKNQIGDIKEQLASSVTPVISTLLQKIKPVLDNVSKWLADNQNQIVSFFVNFPEIAGAAFRAAKKILEQVFSIDFIETLGSATWKVFLINAKNSLLSAFQFIKAIGTTLWEPLTVGFEWAAFGIKKAWRVMVEALIDAINFLLTPINALLGGLESIINNAAKAGAAVQAFIKHPFNEENRAAEFARIISQQSGVSIGKIAVRNPTWGADITRPGDFSDNAKRIENAWADAMDQWKNGSKEALAGLMQFGKDIAPSIAPIVEEGKKEITDILNRNVKGMINPVVASLDAMNDIAKKNIPESQILGTLAKPVGVENLLKPIVDLTARYMEMETRRASDANLSLWQVVKIKALAIWDEVKNAAVGSLNYVTSGMQAFAQYIWGAVQATEAYQSIMSGITELISDIATTVVDPLFNALRPVIDVFLQIVDVVMQSLLPVIQMVGEFVGAISPFFAALVPIFSELMQVVQAIVPIILVFAEIIANTITPILMMLAPVLGLVVSVLQILMPIIAVVAYVFDALSRPVEFVADLLSWLGSWISYLGNTVATAIYNIIHPFKKRSYAESPGGFESDAFTRELVDVSDYLKYSIDSAVSDIESSAATTTVSGSQTTVSRVPDIYIYQYFQAPVIGANGITEVGEYVVKAVQAYAGIGGAVNWESA